MYDSLYIAATGLNAEKEQLDTISHNLTNLQTTAFKKSRINFTDIVHNTHNQDTVTTAIKHAVTGQGVAVTGKQAQFTVGDLKQTQNPLDLAIRGHGFFEVKTAEGDYAYTRNGSLKIDREGYLTSSEGDRLSQQIQIPIDTKQVVINLDGSVSGQVGHDGSQWVNLGQIELATFTNQAGLEAVGQQRYRPSDASGPAIYSVPGENGAGELQQGFLEASNVSFVEEMVALVVAQQAYRSSAQVIRAIDEMLRINNSFRG